MAAAIAESCIGRGRSLSLQWTFSRAAAGRGSGAREGASAAASVPGESVLHAQNALSHLCRDGTTKTDSLRSACRLRPDAGPMRFHRAFSFGSTSHGGVGVRLPPSALRMHSNRIYAVVRQKQIVCVLGVASGH